MQGTDTKMANIIEQQDLLKGLPDARLSLLLQSPDASIPPFLVAAEAQRRQAIRQQFAGDGGKESVVDTLTKQLSSVPQNIQAPMRTPPQMPPLMQPQMQPQMAGIGALPQGQQQMANGGPVRRFASEGFVSPSNPFDYVRENYPISSLPNTIANAGSVIGEAWNSPTAKQATDRLLMETGRAADFLTLNPYTSQVLGIDPKSVRERREQSEIEDIAPTEGILDIEYPDVKIVPGRNPLPDKPSTPPDPNAGKENTSPNNKGAPAQDEIRKRIEALYGSEDPSSWEDAQKWFAMSAQFLDGDKSLMQSLVGAGNVYAGAEGEQARLARDDARAREEALLRYDIGKAEDEASNQSEALKARTSIATGQLDDLYRQQRDVAEQLRRIEESAIKDGTDPALLEGQKALLTRQFNAIGSKISTYEGFIGQTYGFPTIPVVDTASGTIK
jgi:hypothetical protein